MAEALFLALGLAAALAGMGLLSLSLEVHWSRALAPRPFPGERCPALRRAGAGFLLASLVACHLADHASLAWLVWFMLLALAQVSVALLLASRPRALGWLARIIA